jgi:hypothetical protein
VLDPVAGPTHAVAEAAGGLAQPVGGIAEPVVAAAAPVLDPVAGPTHAVAEAAGGLAQPVGGIAEPVVAAAAPVLDPVAGPTHAVAEAAGGLAQPVGGIAEPVTEPITSNLAPHIPAADSYLRGADAGFSSAVGAGLSPQETAVAAAGDPGGIGGVVGSILDSVADGSLAPPAGTAHYASVVALVAALGFTASRFGSAVSSLAGSSGGGIRLGVRLAWLAAWDSSRCVIASTSGLAGTSSPAILASATSAGVGGFPAKESAAGGTSAARAGETVRSFLGQIVAPGRPEGSPLPGPMSPAWSFGRLLRGLLLLAGGLLGLAVFPVRHRGQMSESPVRVSLAVIAISILIAMGVVLLVAA